MPIRTDEYVSYSRIARWCLIALGGCILFVVGLVLLWGWVSPKMNLYRAETEKKAVIAEQRAKSEAAEFAAITKEAA